MQKTILITGSTDGIGLEAAKMLRAKNQNVLLHGRNPAKLEAAVEALDGLPGEGTVESYVADLSRLAEVIELAAAIAKNHKKLDVLINNAGIYQTPNPITPAGLDMRFVVNTLAPALLTKRLLTLLDSSARVINLSSAAQSPVDPAALAGKVHLDHGPAYAQSKLALTMWSRQLALALGETGPMIVAVNPGSMLGSKMVTEAFNVDGGDIAIGADILCRAALDSEFASATGKYFDNDSGQFADPHPDALDDAKSGEIVQTIEKILANLSN